MKENNQEGYQSTQAEYGTAIYIPSSTNIDTMARWGNKITSFKELRNDSGESSPTYFWAYGWVDIIDKNEKPVYHYTTAEVHDAEGRVTATSGRQWGTGKVEAQSSYTDWGYAYVYYGYTE